MTELKNIWSTLQKFCDSTLEEYEFQEDKIIEAGIILSINVKYKL